MTHRTRRRWLITGLAAGLAAGATAWLLSRARAARQAVARSVDPLTEHALARIDVPTETRFVAVNGLRLHTVVAGPADGPLVVLLHGFPECWLSWQHQIVPLVQAGYRVVVPDQRGYNLSDKPPGVQSYAIDHLTTDVRALVRAFDRDRAIVVGHDWGGVVAWRFAMDHPEVVEKLIVMNAPHPATFARELRSSWSQRLKSWYAAFFQIPWLPETLLTLAPLAAAQVFFRRTTVREEAFSEADLLVMASAMAQPGGMRSMINWYRAALRYPAAQGNQVIESPTLLVWGEDDVALGKPLTYGLEEWVPDLALHYIPNCGHWVQNEAPDEVNRVMLDFIAQLEGERAMPKRIEPGPGQESVWDYPRRPRVEATSKHVRVVFNNVVIADTVSAKRVLQLARPPVYYIPTQDVEMEHLVEAPGSSFCEWKGQATYYTVVVGERQAEKAVWAYLEPLEGYESIRDHVAFYAGSMDECTVAGERVTPQPGGFYGGWITKDIVGPFKGEPGTEDW